MENGIEELRMEAFLDSWLHSRLAGKADEAQALEKVAQEAVLWKADETGSRRDAQPAPGHERRAAFGTK